MPSRYETVEVGGLQLARVIRSDDSMAPGSSFYTPSSSQFQIGIHVKKKGSITDAHYYRRAPITIEKPVQEIFHILAGRAIISLYDRDNKHVAASVELRQGDTMLIIEGTAHGVEFLEDTKLLEIKQGPFDPAEKVSVSD